MIEIRIHGRGGQGNVVAAYLLAIAAFEEGKYAQAFPAFGAERRGAPVVAFVRIGEHPIRHRSQVREPAFLIVQDQALLRIPGVLDGLRREGRMLVNAPGPLHPPGIAPGQIVTLPAARLANEILGRPVPNTALLAAFLALTGLLRRESLLAALGQRFSGSVLERNLELVAAAEAAVAADCWREVADAPGA